MRATSSILSASLIATLVVSFSSAVFAETNRTIEEVVVTAEKRESTVQKTSIAITAYSDEMLELRGIDSVEDLQFSAPNLVISPNSQSPVTYAYIRGIGSDQLVAGFDPGVAYNIDGVYVGQPSSMPGDLWDLERVEVLRGPQGTLYGRNTTGGSINLLTKNPTEEFQAFGDVTFGDYDRRRIRGVINGGNETVSGRLSFISDENDGYQDNLTGSNGDVTDLHSFRGKLKFTISDRAEFLLTAQRFQNDGQQSQKKREAFAPVELAPGFIVDVYNGAIPNPTNPRKVAKDYKEDLDLTNTMVSAKFTYDWDAVRLVAITGLIRNDWFQTSDIDMSNNPVQTQDWDMETRQVSQEIQLVSNSDGPWDWILGVFYFDEELETDYVFDDTSVAGFTFMNGGDLDTRSTAIYGQTSYDMRDSGSPFKLTAGLRWTKDEKDIFEYQQIPQFAVDLSGPMDEDWSEMSGKLALDWFISDDVLGYASYSHGYKGGGYSMGQFDAFDPEKVDSLEVGIKSQFWDNRAQVNVALFSNDYKDLQVNFLEFTSFTTDNAAEASIDGLEIESTFLPVEGLTLNVNLTWLDATFDDYQFTPVIDLSGDTLNRAPEYTIGLSAQYEWQLGQNGDLLVRFDYYWQDEVYYRVQNVDRHKEDSFSTSDARLVWNSPSGKWLVDAFVKNISDDDNLRGLTVSDGLSTGNNSFESYYPPRTYGVRLGWRM